MMMKHFDTDYMEGAHPLVMQRLMDTNLEQTPGYGTDRYTAEAKALIMQELGTEDVDIHFLVGGTQTNSTVIDGILMHHEGVVGVQTAHINVHESGAIESCGHKVITLPSHDGKMDAEELRDYNRNFYADDTYEHMTAPGMVYISYPTEYGTLYSKSELTALHDVCREAHIPLYIDGARLGYGLASDACEIKLSDLPQLCDVFYIGGTKVGALFGECVVARKGLLKHFFPLIKQHGALMAKGRLLGVQFGTLFSKVPSTLTSEPSTSNLQPSTSNLEPPTSHLQPSTLYQTLSRHAIELAMLLKQGFVAKGYKLFLDSPTNQQFFVLPNEVMDRLHKTSTFELWGPRGEHETTVRFVTSWATKREYVEALINEL